MTIVIHLTVRNRFEPSRRHEWATRHKFPSPVGPWTARFHDPLEFHMGADGWQLSLLAHGWNMTWQHRHIRGMHAGKGFHLPPQYQPWCSAQPIIALHAWDNVVHLYNVGEQRCIERPVAIPHGIQWAPRGDKLAVTLEGQITILNAKGEGFDIPVHHPRYELPDIFGGPMAHVSNPGLTPETPDPGQRTTDNGQRTTNNVGA